MKKEKEEAMKARIAELERKLFEAKASQASTIGVAFDRIHEAGTTKMMASGVVLQLTALGGREIIPPVVVRDGLWPETIVAIQEDLRRSFEIATMVNPAMARTAPGP